MFILNNPFSHIDYKLFTYCLIFYTCRVDLGYKETKYPSIISSLVVADYIVCVPWLHVNYASLLSVSDH